MLPKRPQHIDNTLERDMEQWVREMIDEQLELAVDQLIERMTAMLGTTNRGNLIQHNNNHWANSDVEAGVIEDIYDEEVPHRHHRVVVEEDQRRWEMGMRIEILEFHDSLQLVEFLDWLVSVEEILDFKEVPNNKRMPLVATKLSGRVIVWW